MNQEITFPIMNITPYIFDKERVYFSDRRWERNRVFKESDLQRIPEWVIVDSDGKIFNAELSEKVKRKKLFSFIPPKIYDVKLDIVNSGKQFELNELIELILTNKNKMFHIYHNRIMSTEEYVNKIKGASDFLELIDIASFGDFKEN